MVLISGSILHTNAFFFSFLYLPQCLDLVQLYGKTASRMETMQQSSSAYRVCDSEIHVLEMFLFFFCIAGTEGNK